MNLYEDYAKEILKFRWEDIEDWGLETSCFWANLGDMMLSVNDMGWILEYEIPRETVYERRDMRSWWYYSDRVKQAIKDTKGKHKDYPFKDFNLISFHKYFSEWKTN